MIPVLDYSKRVRKVKPAVVKVLDSNSSQEGSGFLIDKRGIIITAKHVISAASSTRVRKGSDLKLAMTSSLSHLQVSYSNL
jgi:S1-C subfamily serine protease